MIKETFFLKMFNVIFVVITQAYFLCKFSDSEVLLQYTKLTAQQFVGNSFIFDLRIQKRFSYCTGLLSLILSSFLPSFQRVFHETSGSVLFSIFISKCCWIESFYWNCENYSPPPILQVFIQVWKQRAQSQYKGILSST